MEQDRQKKLKYERIMDDLLERIRNKDFSYDTAFCTEKQLSEQYGVSRITAKRALSELEQQGILFRRRKAGSFISRDAFSDVAAAAPSDSNWDPSTQIISFQMPFDATQGGMYDTIKAINDAISANHALMSIHISDISAEKEQENLRLMLSQNISALIYYPLYDNMNQELIDQFVFSGKKVILLDKSSDCPYVNQIVSDNTHGGRLLASHLMGLGHTQIGFLTTVPMAQVSTTRTRFGGFIQELLLAGILPDQRLFSCQPQGTSEEAIRQGDSTFAETIRQMHQDGATAILTENDRTAYLALLACQQLKLRVPEDISICGFDDSSIAQENGLTTIRQNFLRIGKAVSQLLFPSMDGAVAPATGFQKIVVPVELVVRSSTGAPRSL
ncbi:MAG: GntR family transcriptional regulator [Lachnospiraceae bacterium]|nr:GntR family transcriptional regulator [Lachnospiraceae bacterium]